MTSDPVELNLEQILRTGMVRRWHIIRLPIDQSVGEHVYSVVHIALWLCHKLQLQDKELFPECDFTVGELCTYGIFHDCEESLVGDIPSPTKQKAASMGVIWNDVIHAMVQAPKSDSIYIQDLLRMGDLMDAWRFVRTFGTTPHAKIVAKKLLSQAEQMASRHDKSPHYQSLWDRNPDRLLFPWGNAITDLKTLLMSDPKELVDFGQC